MRKPFRTAATLMALAILSSCEFISFEEYEIPPYDGDLHWTCVTRDAGWSGRQDLAAVAFGGKIWVLGGYNPGAVTGDPYCEDVWSSVDGIAWKIECDSAPWMGRRGHTVTVFDDGSGDAMYLAGGFSVDEATGYRQYNNDVWRSRDGIKWDLIKERTYPASDTAADWFPRMNHAMVVAGQGSRKHLFLIGGSTMRESGSARYAYQYFNDVWRSDDGIHWTNLHCDDFGIRAGHAAVVDERTGKIYLQGGNHGIIFESDNGLNRPLTDWHWLWSSSDGITWEAENDTADFSQGYLYRAEHQMAFLNGSLYAFPGCTNSTMHFHFALTEQVTTWKMDGNHAWAVDSNGSDTDARYSYGFIIQGNRVWILGGDTNRNGPSNDVWIGEIKQ